MGKGAGMSWPVPAQIRPRLQPASKVTKRRSRNALSSTGIQRHVQLRGFPADVFHQEPFNAYPIATIGCVHQMVEYFLRVWAPQQGKAFAIEGHSNPYLSLLFPFALQHAVLFESLVALSRVSSLLSQGNSAIDDRAFLYHRANTQAALQLRINSVATCADDITILTVACLSTIDYLLGQHEEAEPYLRSMRQMVQLRGGLKSNSSWELFMTTNISAFNALWSFVAPTDAADLSPELPSPSSRRLRSPSPRNNPLQNEIPVYASHPFSPSFCRALAQIPEAFSNIAVSGMLSVQMVQVLGKIPRSSGADAVGLSSISPVSQSTNLDSVVTDLQRLATLQTTRLEHLLCYSLLAYCLHLQYEHGVIDRRDLSDITCFDAYNRFAQTAEQTEQHFLAWTAVVISSASDSSVGSGPGTKRPIDQMLTTNPAARDARKLVEILQSFLWHDELAPHWKATWEAAMERRRRESPSSRSISLKSILIPDTEGYASVRVPAQQLSVMLARPVSLSNPSP